MMAVTDTSEKGLESLIVASLVHETGYEPGRSEDYDRDTTVDLAKLMAFVQATQPGAAQALSLDMDCPRRAKFLYRLQGEIAKRGVIDVLRRGIQDYPVSLDLFYGAPTPGNVKAAECFAANIFSVTRQLCYSKDETQLALDLALFINGLPVATFELKNRLTKQTVDDAVQQYHQGARRRPPGLIRRLGGGQSVR